jgi:acetyl esterase/lipase
VQRGEGRALALDIFHGTSPGKRNTVILLHGGSWAAGHRREMHGYAAHLSQGGFVTIAAEYRLTGESAWPAQIRDVKAVIRWVKQNAARLMIDPEKVAAFIDRTVVDPEFYRREKLNRFAGLGAPGASKIK